MQCVLIPGEVAYVAGTDLEFYTPHKLGPLIQKRGGYDNNYGINRDGRDGPVFVSRYDYVKLSLLYLSVEELMPVWNDGRKLLSGSSKFNRLWILEIN